MAGLKESHEVPHIAHHLWGTRDELTIENGVLLKGDSVCIPTELYERMLSDLHNNHRGIEDETPLPNQCLPAQNRC